MTEITPASRAPHLERDEISIFAVLTPLFRHWRVVVFTPLVCGLLAAGVLLLVRPTYTARTTFVPESPKGGALGASLSGLVGLAGQLGLSAGTANPYSPEFLAELVESREVLRTTLLSTYPDPKRGRSTPRPLLDILEIRASSPAQRIERGIQRLRRDIDVGVEKRTGIVALTVKSPYPSLSADLANHLVRILNDFNIARRQSQSREQRRFTEERLAQTRRELRAAEQALLRFLETNRRYQQSPLLRYEADRLDRAVRLKQDVYVTLTKAYEEARISEVQDTPLLTIIDRADPPTDRSSPRRTIGVLMAMLAGLALGIAAAFIAAFRRSVPPSVESDYNSFRQAVGDASREVRTLIRR